jgi:dolichol-phosphate mannosyltransferase
MRSKHPLLSLVIPVYNEETNLMWHHDQIKEYMDAQGHAYEIIYIDDGSSDSSPEIIKQICDDNKQAHYLSFSRNFGKEAALSAGFARVTGDVTIGIDADGQYPLELIEAFLGEWHKGYDVVIGVRASNDDAKLVHHLGSRMFYRFLKMLDSQQEVVSASTDFRLLDKNVVDAFNSLTEHNRVTRNLIDWLGFRRAYVPFSALERHSGTATYDFQKKLKLAMDGIIKHSTKPLKFIGVVGVLISVISVAAAIFLAIESYALHDPLHLSVTGTAILALLLSFLIGIVLVCQGLLALYLENVYHETQNRPLYIIREES